MSSRTRSSTPRRSPVFRPTRSARWPTPTSAEKAQILWTLGITEHHNGVDNVKSLCNLALLTGHVGRWGSGLVPLRPEQCAGRRRHGALPNKFPGFQDITNPDHRAKFETAYGMELNPNNGKHLTLMLEAMEHGEIKAAYCIGENPADSEASAGHSRALLEGLDILVVQDIFMTATAQLADVVLPSSVGWAECDGTVTSSERRVQRARRRHPARCVPSRSRDHRRARQAHGCRLVGRPNPAGAVGRVAVAVAAPRRHELRAPRSRGRPAVAVSLGGSPRFAIPARLAVGGRPRRSCPVAVLDHRARGSEGATDRRIPAAPHHGSFARLLQHRCPVRRFREPDSQW